MNTPEPCCSCKNLYVNALCKDDPSYSAECWKDLTMGNKKCPQYTSKCCSNCGILFTEKMERIKTGKGDICNSCSDSIMEKINEELMDKCPKCGYQMQYCIDTLANITNKHFHDNTSLIECMICNHCGYYEII